MKKTIWFLFLMATLQGYAQKQSASGPFLPQNDTLYPPTSLQAQDVEKVILVTWQKPVIPGGGTPAGLLGYYVYRNGNSIGFLDDPDSLSLYDDGLEPGIYTYKVTSYYDLTSYGHPGQYAESGFSNSDSVYGGAIYPVPFYESWDMETFQYNHWTFFPSKANWNISASEGNPPPSVVFTGSPELTDSGYALVSPPLLHEFPCAEYKLSIEMKDYSSTFGPLIHAEVYYDSTWHNIFCAACSPGWCPLRRKLHSIAGNFFRIRLTIEPAFLDEPVRIDNILVDFTCPSPDTVSYILNTNIVTLYWDNPCSDMNPKIKGTTGYNVFRTDSTGLPPYSQLNIEVVTDTFYVDTLPVSKIKGKFRYCVNLAYSECPFDTSMSVLVTPSVGLDEPQNRFIKIFPNPVNDLLQIKSEVAIDEISLWSALGVVQFQAREVNDHQISVPTNHLPEGMYWVGISTRSGYVVRKVIIIHQ